MPDDDPTNDDGSTPTDLPFDESDLTEAVEEAMPSEVIDAFKSQAEDADSYREFARILYHDNKKQRDELREARQEVERLKTEGPDNRLVLDEDTSAQIQERLPEDASIEDVPDVLESYHSLREKEQERQQQERRQQAAEVAGVDPEALSDLEPNADLDVQEVEGEDGEQKVAYIEAGDEKEPLDDYLRETYPRFESVLFAGESEGDGSEDEGSTPEGDDSSNVPPPGANDEGDDATGDDEDVARDYINNQSWALPGDEDG